MTQGGRMTSRHGPPQKATLADPIKEAGGQPMAERVARNGAAWPAVLLSALSVVPAVIVATWLAVAIPLLALRAFRPLFAVPIFLAFLVPAVVLAWRAARSAASSYEDVPRWSVLTVLGLAGAFLITNGLLHAEKVILRRDAAAYSLIGHWLAHHGEKLVPTGLASFGGADPTLDPASQAFYPHGPGGALVPQFMSGLPSTLAAVEWGSSWRATLWVPPMLGALALLAFAGLVWRLVGPRWAPLGALLLGLAEPFWYAARAPLSEPMAAVLLLAAFCLIVDAVRSNSGIAAAFGGFLFGICTAVRIDTLREMVLLIPVAGWLAVRDSPLWRLLTLGCLVGLGFGVIDAAFLTKPYVLALRDSLRPLLWFAVAMTLATAGTVWLARRQLLAPPRRLTALVPWGIVAVAVAFTIRPAVQTVHGNPANSLGAFDVASRQHAQGLPVDGTRTYDEWSMHWLAWWLGWLTLAVAVFAATVLVRRILDPARRGDDAVRDWVAPLVVVLGTTVLTLWRPGISPDHPWADRRFVPVVLPGLLLLACYGAKVIHRYLRGALADGSRLPALALACVVLGIVGPIAWASAPLLPKRVEAGSIGAIDRVCADLGPRAAVLLVDGRSRAEWPAALRGECGVAVARVLDVDRANVDRVMSRTRAAGNRPVLMAAESPDVLLKLGFPARLAVDLTTREDQTLYMRRPHDTQPLHITVWLSDG
jgi:hypothetical protein